MVSDVYARKMQLPMEKHNKSDKVALRQKAEELQKVDTSKSVSVIMEAQMLKMIHELEANQMELKIENEELRTQLIDRQGAEESLIASETRYRRLFESAKDGILILDAETGMITDVNPFLIEMLGYSKDQFRNKAIWEIGFLKDIVANLDKFLELQQKEYVRYDDLPLETAAGRKISVEFVSNSYFENNKKVIQCNIRETTIRKQAELALQKSESHLRTLVQTIPDLIWLKDTNGVYLSCNPMFERFFGANEADIIGKTDYDFVDRELADFFRRNDRKAIEEGKPTSNEEWVTFADNGYRAFLDTIKTPIYDSDGTLHGILGIGRDITERKKAEDALFESEIKYRSFFENSMDAILLTSPDGKILSANQAACNMFGYTEDELIKLGRSAIADLSDSRLPVLLDERKLKGKARGEVTFLRKDRTRLPAEISSAIFKNHEGFELSSMIIRDITDHIIAKKKLISAKEKAQESDRLKSAFLSNMSHEIRTPLNSIIGFSELLGDPDFEEDQKTEFTQHIIANGNNLLKIISDIMDISKIESGEITIRKKHINAHEYVLGIYEQFSLQAGTHKPELILNLPDNDKEIEIFADPDRLRQIFNNLISNALKFTSNGNIEIGYRPKSKMMEFFVKDTGIGIPASYHHKIFDRFRQVEDSKTRKYGGNGLGLAITKNLVKLMGGKIWVESEVDKGSAFYFTMPMN